MYYNKAMYYLSYGIGIMKKKIKLIIAAVLIMLPIAFILNRFLSIQAVGNVESVKYHISASRPDLKAGMRLKP